MRRDVSDETTTDDAAGTVPGSPEAGEAPGTGVGQAVPTEVETLSESEVADRMEALKGIKGIKIITAPEISIEFTPQ